MRTRSLRGWDRRRWKACTQGAALVLGIGAVVSGEARASETSPIHVFLVRHAEVQRGAGGDPSLSPKGEARAFDLAHTLAPAGVTHAFASEYARTQETLQPVAEQAAIEVRVISARDPEAQIAALTSLPAGAVAVVAGHSNTVPTLVRKLGGTMADVHETQHGLMFDESQFDRLVLVVLRPRDDQPAELVSSLEMRYGEPSGSRAER